MFFGMLPATCLVYKNRSLDGPVPRGTFRSEALQRASHERGMIRRQPPRVLLCAIEDDNACSRRQERCTASLATAPAPSTTAVGSSDPVGTGLR